MNDRRNAWNRPTRIDTLFNGALIAAGIVGLLLGALDAPPPAVAGLVLSETIAAATPIEQAAHFGA